MRRAFSHESKNKCHDLLRTKFNSQVPNVWQADYVGHKGNSERQNIGQRMDADESVQRLEIGSMTVSD